MQRPTATPDVDHACATQPSPLQRTVSRKRRQTEAGLLSDSEVQQLTHTQCDAAEHQYACALCCGPCIPVTHPLEAWAADRVPRALVARCGLVVCALCLPLHLLHAGEERGSGTPAAVLPCPRHGAACTLRLCGPRSPGAASALRLLLHVYAAAGSHPRLGARLRARLRRPLQRLQTPHLAAFLPVQGKRGSAASEDARTSAVPCPACRAILAVPYDTVPLARAMVCTACGQCWCPSCWRGAAPGAEGCACGGDSRGWSRLVRGKAGEAYALHALTPAALRDATACHRRPAVAALTVACCAVCRLPCDRDSHCFTVQHCGVRMCTWCGATALPWESGALPATHWDPTGCRGCPHFPADPAALRLLQQPPRSRGGDNDDVDAASPAVLAERRRRHAAAAALECRRCSGGER